MSDEREPFHPASARDALGEVEGDFVLPLCLPQPTLMLGEDLTVLVLDTIHGQRVGLPLTPQGVSDLHATLGEAMRLQQARDDDAIQ